MGLGEVDAAITLGLEGARAIAILHSEDDLEYAMAKDFVATGSDGDFPYFGAVGGQLGAPQAIRAYSTYATKLRKYAMERGTISLPQAIRSCTGLPAEILGWPDRGVIREGAKADIVVLDLDALRAHSNLRTPHLYSEGVDTGARERRDGSGARRGYREPSWAHPRASLSPPCSQSTFVLSLSKACPEPAEGASAHQHNQ